MSFNGVNVHLSSQIATLIRYNDLELTSDRSNNLSRYVTKKFIDYENYHYYHVKGRNNWSHLMPMVKI